MPIQREGKGQLLEPSRPGVRDRIDLWYRLSSSLRKPMIKQFMMWSFKTIKALTGITLVPVLSLALKKPGQAQTRSPDGVFTSHNQVIRLQN